MALSLACSAAVSALNGTCPDLVLNHSFAMSAKLYCRTSPAAAFGPIAGAGRGIRKVKCDEAGFADWCATHARGFVMNVHYKPPPGYLVLHKVGCSTFKGRGGFTGR